MRAVLDSFTRPNNTTAYAAGDVVTAATAAVLEFAHAAPHPGSGGVVIAATLIDGACQSTKGDFELWLFDTAPTIDNDNAAWTPTDAELQALVGVIDFGGTPLVGDATSGAGGNVVYPTGAEANLPLPFKCVNGSASLYGVLVVRNAYDPVAQETFAVRLLIAD